MIPGFPQAVEFTRCGGAGKKSCFAGTSLSGATFSDRFSTVVNMVFHRGKILWKTLFPVYGVEKVFLRLPLEGCEAGAW